MRPDPPRYQMLVWLTLVLCGLSASRGRLYPSSRHKRVKGGPRLVQFASRRPRGRGPPLSSPALCCRFTEAERVSRTPGVASVAVRRETRAVLLDAQDYNDVQPRRGAVTKDMTCYEPNTFLDAAGLVVALDGGARWQNGCSSSAPHSTHGSIHPVQALSSWSNSRPKTNSGAS